MVRVNVVRPYEPPGALPHAQSHQELFLLEEEGDVLASEGINEDAVQTRRRLEWLLAPPEHLVPVQASLEEASGGAEEAAATLRRLGYKVKINVSAGGGLRNLRHTFLSVWSTDRYGYGGTEVIVDPSFPDQFAVANPTPRYAFIQSALPRTLVATTHRVLQALTIMSVELARAFKVQDIPLPPWRQLQSLISKYDASTSQDVLSVEPAKQGSSTATSIFPSGITTTTAGAATGQRDRLVLASKWSSSGARLAPSNSGKALAVEAAKRAQQAQRVAAKLAQWGLHAEAPAAEPSGASPTSVVLTDWSSDAGSPPASPPAGRAGRVVQIGFHVPERVCGAYHECVCCGLGEIAGMLFKAGQSAGVRLQQDGGQFEPSAALAA